MGDWRSLLGLALQPKRQSHARAQLQTSWILWQTQCTTTFLHI